MHSYNEDTLNNLHNSLLKTVLKIQKGSDVMNAELNVFFLKINYEQYRNTIKNR